VQSGGAGAAKGRCLRRAFFDGYRANPDYALADAAAVAEWSAGQRGWSSCDTMAGACTDQIGRITAPWIAGRHPREPSGHPYHNTPKTAVQATLAAVRCRRAAGAGHTQRTGRNAAAMPSDNIIPTLLLKEPYASALTLRHMEALAG